MTKAISNDLKKRAVIYCRVSTKEQVEDGNSLVSQERLCREYAAREGFEVTEVFIEKGESAKTADRTELKRMMTFCTARKGAVQAVIAYKVDRISRNIADYSYLRVKLKSAGAEIRSVTEFFEDTPAGRFMENIIANVGQFDNDVRMERCMGGMREAVREGRYVWMAPLGYDNVKLNGKSTIAQNEKGTLIREAFELIAERDQSTEAIRRLMATKGLLNKKAQPVSQSNFYKLIRNPLYKGTIKKMGITSKGSFKPIVSDDLFDIVQNILKGRKNPAKNYLNENPDFPLRRFVSHPSGKRLTGYWSKGKYSKYPYYSFNQPGLTFAKNKLETKFMAFFAQFEFEGTHLNVMRDFLHKTIGRHIDNDAKEVEIIINRIEEINDQIDKLVDIHEKGGITITMLTDRTGKFETELEHLKSILSNDREKKTYDVSGLLKFAAIVLQKPHLLWEKASFKQKKNIQEFVFPKGVTFDGQEFRTPELSIVFNLKSLIDRDLFPVVDYRNGRTNTASTTIPSKDQKALRSKKYWLGILKDLQSLKDRLEDSETAP